MPAGDLAPSLGAEFDISLAVIDTSAPEVTSGLPTLEGDYVLIGCTKDAKIKPPTQKTKAIACKLNPSKWRVPGMGEMGNFNFGSLDFPDSEDDVLAFRNKRCVAKITMSRAPEGLIRTFYVVDWMPIFDVTIPEGEGEVNIACEGEFSRFGVQFGNGTIDWAE